LAVKKIARSAISAHSAAELYALVEDVESYPRFLPWCLSTTVHERTAGTTRATLTVGIRGVKRQAAAKALNGPLFDRIANTMVDAFARRADEIHGPRG